MRSDRLPRRGAGDVVALGHVATGVAALVLAAVLVVASQQPNAELGGVLLVPAVLLGLLGLLFTTVAVTVLRDPRDHRARSRSLVLSVTELAVGLLLTWAVIMAGQGYGAFEPWRSPLLIPAAALLGLGLWGVILEVAQRTRAAWQEERFRQRGAVT